MYYDSEDDSLRYANGAQVPDDAAVWAELKRRGQVTEFNGKPAARLHHAETARRDLINAALAAAPLAG